MCNLSKGVEEKGVAKGILSSVNYDGAENSGGRAAKVYDLLEKQ